MKTRILFIIIFIAIALSCNNKQPVNNVSASSSNGEIDVNNKISHSSTKTFVDSSGTKDLIYFVKHLDNTKGLSNSSINAIFQDSENLIWIGTWDGLNRYDGNSFKIFRPKLNDENSLSNHVILKIGEDDKGLIWILTMNGLNSYDKRSGTFQQYNFSSTNDFTLSMRDFNMAIDSSKTVFCTVKDWGLGYFDGIQFQKIGVENLPNGPVEKMEFTPSGELLLLFESNELFSLEFQTINDGKKFTSKAKIISENIRDFGIFTNQKICLVSIEGDVVIQSLLDQKKQKLQKKNIQNIIGNTFHGLVLSEKTGYFAVNSSGTIRDLSWFKHMNNQVVRTLIQGIEDIIWIGTDGDGLLEIYPHRKSFNLVSAAQVPEFDEGIVRTFLEVEGNSFFIGTKGKGLFRFPSKFYTDSNTPFTYENFNESNSPINNSVYALCKGKNDLVFIGTDGNGIDVFDLKNSKIITWSEILDNELYDYFTSTYSIYQDHNGIIWIGTYGYGLIRFKIEREGENLKVSQFKMYQAGEEEDGKLSSNIIYSIVPKNEDELWIGTRLGGLNLFDKNSELFKVYKNNKNDLKSLSNDDILCLHVDVNEKLWVGTSFGLNLLENVNEDNATFKRFTVKEGLPNNTIHGIESDRNSNLWISTNFGLSNFIVEKQKFINFKKNEGLQNYEYADGAYYQDDDTNFIFMGGIKGFNYFLPSEIEESSIIPDILIDNISGQNKDIPYYQNLVVSSSSKTTPAIVLKHNQNFFDIELSALTYINNEKCQYQYYLSNFNQDWVEIKNRRIISFTNVPPGNYSLWLKWSNSDGIWSKPVQAIDIKIKPVYWQSTVAFVIYTLLFISLVALVISYFKKRISLRQNIIFRKKEDELHQNKLNFFTNIAHELQTPLTLVVGPAQKLSEAVNLSEKNQKFLRMIQRNSSRLLFLTQQLLDFRKAENDHLEVSLKKFDLINLVEQIVELFDEWAIEKNIEYLFKHPQQLIGWYDKDKIEKIIFNLLSNAFKYTPKNGKINIEFSRDTDANILHICVSNTGKGISREELDYLFERFFISKDGDEIATDSFRTGIGLAYVKKLVTVLNGNITVSNKTKDFTSFEVIIPYAKKDFNEKDFDKNRDQVLISRHLKNVLEEYENDSEQLKDKISVLNDIENQCKVILIVEDEKEIHTLLGEILKGKYKILKAFNGIEAMKIIDLNMPDLIISDVMMPEMDGIELCKRIKSDINTCHIPFILLTAKSSISDRIEGLELGANSYIPKPFHPDHLLVRIKKLLEEKELILKHFTKGEFFQDFSNLTISDDDKRFTKTVVELIRKNIEVENLNSSYIEKELGMSNSQLYRKVKQIFGFSTGDLIRTIKIKYAAELLCKSPLTVSQICFQSGFNNRSYFYREFKKTYHITPKEYQLKNKLIFKN